MAVDWELGVVKLWNCHAAVVFAAAKLLPNSSRAAFNSVLIVSSIALVLASACSSDALRVSRNFLSAAQRTLR